VLIIRYVCTLVVLCRAVGCPSVVDESQHLAFLNSQCME
jgi:hypothetical protein